MKRHVCRDSTELQLYLSRAVDGVKLKSQILNTTSGYTPCGTIKKRMCFVDSTTSQTLSCHISPVPVMSAAICLKKDSEVLANEFLLRFFVRVTPYLIRCQGNHVFLICCRDLPRTSSQNPVSGIGSFRKSSAPTLPISTRCPATQYSYSFYNSCKF